MSPETFAVRAGAALGGPPLAAGDAGVDQTRFFTFIFVTMWVGPSCGVQE